MIARWCTAVLAIKLAKMSQAICNDVAHVVESGRAKEKANDPSSAIADWKDVGSKTASLLKGREE